MTNIGITTEEFYNLALQLYPDQSARIIAEIKANKLAERVAELEAKEEEDGQMVD